jgi:hypothetical protein
VALPRISKHVEIVIAPVAGERLADARLSTSWSASSHKKFLLTSVGALFLATGAAHAEDTLTMRGVDWKCRNGMVVRFDQVGGKREEGGSETLIITGIPHGLNNLHITCGKRGCPV